MREKKSLYDEIVDFQRFKKYVALPLIALGLFGLVLPFLPGLIFIVLGLMLIVPQKTEAVIDRIRRLWR